jgi:DNA-binding MarR family transcriptional regulator
VRLKGDGLIEPLPGADRRVQRVRLTALGRTRFAAMAQAHEGWIENLLAGLTEGEADDLIHLLERAKRSLHAPIHEEPSP